MQKPSVLLPVEAITVHPRETLTVWLNRQDNYKGRDCVQIELRVRSDGTPELFTDVRKVIIRDFDEWYSLDVAKAE